MGGVRRLNYLNGDPNQVQFGGLAFQPVGISDPVRFVHPFVVDPNDEGIMYYPAGGVIWRNENHNASNPRDFWTRLDDIAAPPGYFISAVAVSVNPAHILYFGASHPTRPPRIFRRIFRLQQADTAAGRQQLSVRNAIGGGAYVHGIAVNPDNGDEILVVYSNYNVVGLFHSIDGGRTYATVEGRSAH